MALSDALGITAQGLDTLDRTNKAKDFSRIQAIVRKREVTEIVVGNPLRMSGEAGTQSEKAAAFAEELRRRTGLPVHLWDERLTSAEANRLLDEAGMDRMARKGVVDRMAAALILQAFLQSRGLA